MYIKILKNDDDVILLNVLNGGCIKINIQIYEIIKECKSAKDIQLIAEEYDDDDKVFLSCLAEEIERIHLFHNVSSKQLKRVDYLMTKLCNLNCKHCCLSAIQVNADDMKKFKAHMDIIQKIVELQPEGINLTGGEPLTISNINEILEYVSQNYQGKITLATNATLIGEHNVEFLCQRIHHFDISIDGYDEESSTLIRGHGVFNKVIKAIHLLKDNGARSISLSAAFTNSTYKHIQKFIDLCSELGVQPITRYMNPTGRALINQLEDATEIVDFLKPEVRDVHHCTAGIDIISVTEDGSVYPCVNMIEPEFKIGNILHENIMTKLAWDIQLPWFRSFSQYLPLYRNECKECAVNCFCWNCPSEVFSFLRQKQSDKLTTFCEAKKSQMFEALWHE